MSALRRRTHIFPPSVRVFLWFALAAILIGTAAGFFHVSQRDRDEAAALVHAGDE